MTKINLSSLKGDRRKKGRVAQIDPKLLEAIKTLDHDEAIAYVEANVGSAEYKAEMTKAVPSIKKSNPEANAEAVFENRWLSRYRQRAKAVWDNAGMPHDEFDFIIMADGKIYVGRK